MIKVIKKSDVQVIKKSSTKDVNLYFTNEDSPNVSINILLGTGYFGEVEAEQNWHYIVVEGELILTFETEKISLKPDDAIKISKGEKYEMEGNYKVIMVCEPAFGS